MLSVKNRLFKKEDFEKVRRKGKYFFQKGISMGVLPNDLSSSRVGFIVGTKFSKKAVERNLAKRRLREIFRDKISLIKPNSDIVVRLDGSVANDFKTLAESIESLLRQSRLINPDKNNRK